MYRILIRVQHGPDSYPIRQLGGVSLTPPILLCLDAIQHNTLIGFFSALSGCKAKTKIKVSPLGLSLDGNSLTKYQISQGNISPNSLKFGVILAVILSKFTSGSWLFLRQMQKRQGLFIHSVVHWSVVLNQVTDKFRNNQILFFTSLNIQHLLAYTLGNFLLFVQTPSIR